VIACHIIKPSAIERGERFPPTAPAPRGPVSQDQNLYERGYPPSRKTQEK